jgi:hypothetical protein
MVDTAGVASPSSGLSESKRMNDLKVLDRGIQILEFCAEN